MNGSSSAERIERCYLLALSESTTAADEIEKINEEIRSSERREDRALLADVCEELCDFPNLPSLTRGQAHEIVAWFRLGHSPRDQLSRVRMAEAIYENVGDQRRLAWALTLVGDAQLSLGEGELGRKAHERALKIRRKLVSAEQAPSLMRGEAWRDVFVSLNRLAQIHQDHAQTTQADQMFDEALRIILELTKANPQNAAWQGDLLMSLRRSADRRAEAGLEDEARQAFAHTIAAATEFAGTNPVWQSDAMHARLQLGEFAQRDGRDADARDEFREAERLARNLTEYESSEPTWRTDLATSLFRLSEVETAGDEQRKIWTKARYEQAKAVELTEKHESANALALIDALRRLGEIDIAGDELVAAALPAESITTQSRTHSS